MEQFHNFDTPYIYKCKQISLLQIIQETFFPQHKKFYSFWLNLKRFLCETEALYWNGRWLDAS
jgi:hypothetical protein